MTFDAFLAAAWDEHGDRPQAVADRLASSLDRVGNADEVARYAALVTHVYGEHLGTWHAGIRLIGALRALPACNDAATAASLDCHAATLRHASADVHALNAIAGDDRIFVLASAAAMFAGRNDFARAIGNYTQALAGAQHGVAGASPATRALAVGGNNLAAALEQKPDRDAVQTRAMVMAAESALRYWKLAGTWLEEERAEYRLCQSLLQAGDAPGAVRSAVRCAAICAGNDAPACERFFAHAALAAARRAAGDVAACEAARAHALALFDTLAADERTWCENDAKALRA
ncbi:MAG: hypothetical protein ABI294_02645 [Casimicrobiaceae bacterium]